MVPIKDCPYGVFSRQTVNALSDKAIPTCEFNAVSLEVTAWGTNPSATISLEGSPENGGNYLPISSASKSGVTSSQIIDFGAPSSWVKVRIADISGPDTVIRVIATPFVSPGPTSITAVVQ